MSTGSVTGATSVASPQYQAVATKTALDAQKQEGENAANLIESAVQATEHSISGPSDTGNNLDAVV